MPSGENLGVEAPLAAPLHDPHHFLAKFLVLRQFPQVCPCIYLAQFCIGANLRDPAQTWLLEDLLTEVLLQRDPGLPFNRGAHLILAGAANGTILGEKFMKRGACAIEG